MIAPRPIIRRASREDIEAFSQLQDKPTVKAWCMEKDGKIVGLAGLALIRGRWHAFCDLEPDARVHKISIVRTAKKIFAEARKQGIRFVYADADPKEPRAVAWMTSLGFIKDPRTQYLYRWSGKK
jgi:N-acetylglutamate synthase-like GNAT family acetyltransferase